MMIVAWCLPLMTLCALAMGKDCFDARAVTGMVEREAPNVGEVKTIAAPRRGQTRRPPLIPHSQGHQVVVLMCWP